MKIKDITAPTVDLRWQGPVSFDGKSKSPSLKDDAIDGSGVYIYAQKYEAKTVLYVGQSRCLWDRMFQHVANFAGAKYWLRDNDGLWVYNPRKGMIASNQPGYSKKKRLWDELPQIILDNVSRLNFIWASISKEDLDNVETTLIEWVRDLDAKVECENERSGTGKVVPLKHDLTNLSDDTEVEFIKELFQPKK